MHTLDEATEAYIARLLDEAPPLPSDLTALVVRTFSTTPDSPLSEAA